MVHWIERLREKRLSSLRGFERADDYVTLSSKTSKKQSDFEGHDCDQRLNRMAAVKFIFSLCPRQSPVLLLSCGSGLHTSGCDLETHYDTLGIKRTASKEDIKQAYIRMGKEFHPDLQANNDSDTDAHKKFVAVNEAYSVLSKPESKKIYDLGLIRGEPEDHGSTSVHGFREYSFEERARRYGFQPTNHNYYKNDKSRYVVVVGCMIFIVVGYVVHYNIARMTAEKHIMELNKNNEKYNSILEESKTLARTFNSREEQIEHFRKVLTEHRAKIDGKRPQS